MKVQYDKKVDAAHIRFSSKRPVGGVELKEAIPYQTLIRQWLAEGIRKELRLTVA